MSLKSRLHLLARNFSRNLLKAVHTLSSSGYSFITINLNGEIFKFYTHYEGVLVINELLILNQYNFVYRLKPRVTIDLGAHIGVFTISVAKNIIDLYGNGLVIAVEPNIVNYYTLVNNIKINGVGKVVKAIKAAVASNQGFVEVEWIGIRDYVRTITMDSLIEIVRDEGYSEVDLVKIDIEGAELDILINDVNWLKYVKALVMELHPQIYGLKGLKAIFKNLKKQGFNVICVENIVDSRLALLRWLRRVTPSPSWLIMTLWRLLITPIINEHRIRYFIAIKE